MNSDGIARLMASFWFYRKRDMAALIARAGQPTRLMVDSGAFSAHERRGHSGGVRLTDYAAWLKDNWPVITTAINLDVISNPAASAKNQLALEERGLPVIPVWHAGSPYTELEALCRDYSYVAVGGPAVTENRRKLLLAMSAKAIVIAREHGTSLHGLGRSGLDDLAAIPWYSADASSWIQAFRFGSAVLYTHPGQLRKMSFPQAARTCPRVLRDHGVDPATVHRRYAHLQDRTDKDVFRKEVHAGMGSVTIAYKKLEEWLQSRHQVPAPPGYHDPGPGLFLVVVNPIIEAAVIDGVRWLTAQETGNG